MKKSSGQSIVEYVLIGLTIAVVSIAALSMLGGNLQDVFFAMLPAPKAKPIQMASSNPPPTAGAPSESAPTAGVGVVLTTKNGNTITLDSYPQNVSTLVATTGANGATNVLADTLTNLAKQLLQAGEITKPQYEALVALANAGHGLAEYEKEVEDLAASATTTAQLRDTIDRSNLVNGSLQPSGESVYVLHIGYNDSNGASPLDPSTITEANGGTAILLSAYQKAVGMGALKDPATQQVVSSLVEQMAVISNELAHSTYKMKDGEVPLTALAGLMASNLTNQKSASICEVGNGTDSGVSCK